MGRDRIEAICESAEATQDFAAGWASTLSPHCVIALSGGLGAGKTTFMKGLLRGLNGQPLEVQSPTFVYLHPYLADLPVYHFDLYRLRSSEEFRLMGFDEYFEMGGITAIEWPERIGSLLPDRAIWIHFSMLSEHSRQLVIQ
ncbi:MAG: yjeE [Parachlamydiales bacterium]|nr:yjeE [Parachlamydiales bacterium]